MQCKFSNQIDKDTFLHNQLEVYEKWFRNNKNDKEHLVPYAMTLYLTDDEKYTEVLKEYYNESYNYEFDNPSLNDIFMFVAGFYLNELELEPFKDTVYSHFAELDDDELLNSFVGFWD